MVQNLSVEDVQSFIDETGVFFVIFKKKDGSEREMFATTDWANIPDDCLPKGNDTGRKAKPEGLFTVFDLAKQEWRNFYADSIVYIESLPASFGLEAYRINK